MAIFFIGIELEIQADNLDEALDVAEVAADLTSDECFSVFGATVVGEIEQD